ncbi:hypothetical protein BGZ60DRAFT_189887 [Tricladium varicosporioides]|nr:hypothetical protein BGZ60DRAFT_189887 [Hymenoscyphus varicosporioides]
MTARSMPICIVSDLQLPADDTIIITFMMCAIGSLTSRLTYPWSYFHCAPFDSYSSMTRPFSTYKPHIAYLSSVLMDLSVTYLNIVRGIKNQRPRQPVPSTLLALTSAPGGLIRTNISFETACTNVLLFPAFCLWNLYPRPFPHPLPAPEE